MINILVLGDAILDRYLYGTINRVSPEDYSISVFDVEKEEYRLGGCMNVATNIRSISYPEFFNVSLSSVFSVFTGKMLFDRNIQCDDSCMVYEDAAGKLQPSNYELIKTRIINQDTKKQMLRIDNRKQFSDRDIEFYKDSFGKINKQYDAVIVSDYNKGLVDEFTLKKLKQFKGLVFVDSKNHDLAFWDGIKNCFIKINELEYIAATSNTKHPLIVTMGDVGAYLWKDQKPSKYFKTKKVDKSDVTGAGDVFLAGLVVDYMRNKDLHSAIEFANMCAGVSVKQQGTTEVRL